MQRELNEIEYLNWCVEQPYNMVVAVRIGGRVHPAELRAALDTAQLRQPMLRVNTKLGANGIPYFDSNGVGSIPLTVVECAAPDAAQRLFDSELSAVFARDQWDAPQLPLLHAALLLPAESHAFADLVLTVQHVIGDGLSVAFLVRDLLRFMAEPNAEAVVVDAAASPVDLLPAKVRRRLPRHPYVFQLVLLLAKLYAKLRGHRRRSSQPHVRFHCSWTLSAEQTARLRARCRTESVSVQSALSTAFFPEFPWIHMPVNLRPVLARPVGDAFGLFVGAAEVRLNYRGKLGFWSNARRCHRRLRKALKDPFGVFRLFSKAVPYAKIRELGPLLVSLAGSDRPFAVTNLGVLDALGLAASGPQFKLESFYGAVSGIVESSVLTVYTLAGVMHLQLLASETSVGDTTIRDAAGRAVARLLEAIDQ